MIRTGMTVSGDVDMRHQVSFLPKERGQLIVMDMVFSVHLLIFLLSIVTISIRSKLLSAIL